MEAKKIKVIKPIVIFITMVIIVFVSLKMCDAQAKYDHENASAYDKVFVSFVGDKSSIEIEYLFRSVMKKYNLEETEENIEKVASMLIALRKESKTGVTEIEILKHMDVYGSVTATIPDQAALSFMMLEEMN